MQGPGQGQGSACVLAAWAGMAREGGGCSPASRAAVPASPPCSASTCVQLPDLGKGAHLSLRGSSTSYSCPSRPLTRQHPAWPSCASAPGGHGRWHGPEVHRLGCEVPRPIQVGGADAGAGATTGQNTSPPALTRSSKEAAGPSLRLRLLPPPAASAAPRLPATDGASSFSTSILPGP